MSFDFTVTGCWGEGHSTVFYTSSDLRVTATHRPSTESSERKDSRDIEIIGKKRGVPENVTAMHRFPLGSGTQGYSVDYKNGNTKIFQRKNPQEDECKKVSDFLSKNGINHLMLTDLLCKREKRAYEIIESDGYTIDKYGEY